MIQLPATHHTSRSSCGDWIPQTDSLVEDWAAVTCRACKWAQEAARIDWEAYWRGYQAGFADATEGRNP